MTPAILLSCTLLIGSIPMASQTAAPQHKWVILQVPQTTRSCPVSIRAQHAADGNMLAVDRGRPSHPKGIAQRLLLTLSHPNSREITGARITIHGFSAKSRLMGAMTTQSDSDAARTMDVAFSVAPGKVASADVWVPGMSAVSAIDLESVTYADGSTWRFSTQDGCHVAAENLMLIAAH